MHRYDRPAFLCVHIDGVQHGEQQLPALLEVGSLPQTGQLYQQLAGLFSSVDFRDYQRFQGDSQVS
ncbi:MAG: hypothetical protein DRI39_06115 [Chloroflexi bacterium]|nr:MAG: hypothetical protein DRI39_06115 [Chloroflexota bacterium]